MTAGVKPGKRGSTPNGAGRRHRSRGTAAIEFALLLPILILLIFGMIEFGRGYNAKITLTHAAREGVRVMALDSGSPVAAAEGAAGSIPVTVSTTGGPCSSAANAGTPVSVTVRYALPYSIPLFSSGSFNLAETATMRCGG